MRASGEAVQARTSGLTNQYKICTHFTFDRQALLLRRPALSQFRFFPLSLAARLIIKFVSGVFLFSPPYRHAGFVQASTERL